MLLAGNAVLCGPKLADLGTAGGQGQVEESFPVIAPTLGSTG